MVIVSFSQIYTRIITPSVRPLNQINRIRGIELKIYLRLPSCLSFMQKGV